MSLATYVEYRGDVVEFDTPDVLSKAMINHCRPVRVVHRIGTQGSLRICTNAEHGTRNPYEMRSVQSSHSRLPSRNVVRESKRNATAKVATAKRAHITRLVSPPLFCSGTLQAEFCHRWAAVGMVSPGRVFVSRVLTY